MRLGCKGSKKITPAWHKWTLTLLEQQVKRKSRGFDALRHVAVETQQRSIPHRRIQVLAAVGEQMTAIGYCEFRVSLECHHLMAYTIGLVPAEIASGTQDGIMRQGHNLVVVAIEQMHLLSWKIWHQALINHL